MKILERLRAGAGRALQDGPVLFAYLFGSRASGRAGERSDVDVAVFLDDSVPPERYLDVKLELPGRLEATTGIDGIEVLVLNDAPLMLAGRAIRDRLLVYSRDDPRRVRFEGATIRQFLDFEIHSRPQAEAVLLRMAERRT